jgi:Protein of unknown function (DUF3574)
MRKLTPIILGVISAAYTSQAPTRAAQVTAPSSSVQPCGPLGKSYTRTTLYFGLTSPAGIITERQWQTFLRDEVTSRFPDGLTVWEAKGQWRHADGRIDRERAKVLLLVHDEKASVRSAISSLITTYKQSFQQESVLWETAPVCATF